MSIEENKATMRRHVEEVYNKGYLSIVDEIMALNYVYHVGGMDIKGPEGYKGYITMTRTAMPDLNVTINDIVAEGNTVACSFTITGTFKGEYMGIAPTGRQVNITEAHFIRFEGGKEVETTSYSDSLTLYRQLGVSPPTR